MRHLIRHAQSADIGSDPRNRMRQLPERCFGFGIMDTKASQFLHRRENGEVRADRPGAVEEHGDYQEAGG